MGWKMEQYFFKKERTSVFRANTTPRLAYMYLTDAEKGKWYRATHSHKNIVEVSVILGGDVDYNVNGRNFHAETGDFVVMNAGMAHEEKSDNPDIAICCLGIKDLSLNGRRKNCIIEDGTKPLFSGSSYNVTVGFLIKTIYSAINHENRLCTGEAVRYLMTALVCMIIDAEQKEKKIEKEKSLDRAAAEKDDEALVNKVKEFLDTHYKENISLDELAKYFFVGKYHMCHIFKERYGCSAIDYVIGRRIGEAQTMLVETDLRISDIAAEMGFSSSGYFSTQFLKRTGRTPYEYRALKTKTLVYESGLDPENRE